MRRVSFLVVALALSGSVATTMPTEGPSNSKDENSWNYVRSVGIFLDGLVGSGEWFGSDYVKRVELAENALDSLLKAGWISGYYYDDANEAFYYTFNTGEVSSVKLENWVGEPTYAM